MNNPLVSAFPEMDRLKQLSHVSDPLIEVRTLTVLKHGVNQFPITAFVFGSKDKSKPTLGIVGGVHGLERIGSHVALAYLDSLIEQLKWDDDLRSRFNDFRLLFIPIINPVGMFLGRRSNGNGVDLMRNSPTIAEKIPLFLVGGHRLSASLPWYRGPSGMPMETEAQTLVDFIKAETFSSEFLMTVDIHSGFGMTDKLWFPYAKTNREFPRIKEVRHFTELFTEAFPHHIYNVEAQSSNYTTHGDLWDYLFDEHQREHGENGPAFVPWTLEMGSWKWIQKNPSQLFSSFGIFNPIEPHRYRRIMRRHLTLLDFFGRATKAHRKWAKRS